MHNKIYMFKKPSVAATVAVFAKKEKSLLMIRRLRHPGKGKYGFPGGFLNVDKETVYETGARELFEETGVQLSPKKFLLLDVRSRPDRDPRGHVVDVGFLCIIPKEIVRITCSTETEPFWIPIAHMRRYPLAFDYDEMLRDARHVLGTLKLL